jgi:hypothetical protein
MEENIADIIPLESSHMEGIETIDPPMTSSQAEEKPASTEKSASTLYKASRTPKPTKKTSSTKSSAKSTTTPRTLRSSSKKNIKSTTPSISPISGRDEEESPRRSNRGKRHKPAEASSSPVLVDLVPFEDENNVSTFVDDEGRPGSAANHDDNTSKPSNRASISSNSTNSQALKKRRWQPSSMDGDDATTSHKKPIPLPPLNGKKAHYAPPPAGSSREDLLKHVTTEVLKHHGTLSHNQVMKEASKHEPFVEALRQFPGNWRIDLVARLGNPSFMPHLQREFLLVTLPLQ